MSPTPYPLPCLDKHVCICQRKQCQGITKGELETLYVKKEACWHLAPRAGAQYAGKGRFRVI